MSNNERTFTVGEFSQYTGINAANLRYYDSVDLLHPAGRSDNNYRYYTESQIELASAIESLRVCRVSIRDIKQIMDNPGNDMALATFERQLQAIEEDIRISEQVRDIIKGNIADLKLCSALAIPTILTNIKDAQTIFMGDPVENVYSDIDAQVLFINECRRNCGPAMTVSTGLLFEDGYPRDGHGPARPFVRTPKGNHAIQAGLYVHSYATYESMRSGEQYDEIEAYLSSNGYEPCGPFLSECPAAGFFTTDIKDYTVCVSVPVSKIA